MQLTRCPACHTTFRITAEALQKAGGRVRCGRCAAVFDAREELREEAASPADTPAPTADCATSQAAAPVVHSGAPAASIAAPPHPPAPPQSVAAPMARDDLPLGEESVAELVAQIERGGDRDADASADAAISEAEIDVVLESAPARGEAAATPDWLNRTARASRWWPAGVLLATVALAVQAVHYFRNDLAANAALGPILQEAYALLGVPLSPRWDLQQYQILDWIAAAEPNANGQGSLRISARVHNRGPRAQPYPHIHLQLADQRQTTVGSRVFRPAEYLASRPRRDGLMEPGTTARAELEVVDPGPDAYGFELDVCIEIDAVLRCSAERVFK